MRINEKPRQMYMEIYQTVNYIYTCLHRPFYRADIFYIKIGFFVKELFEGLMSNYSNLSYGSNSKLI